MREEDLKKAFDQMNAEEIDMLTENLTERSDALRAERILASVYRKTGVQGAAAETPDAEKTGRRAALLRFMPFVAVLAVVLAVAGIAVMRISTRPKVLPRDTEAGSIELVLPITVYNTPTTVDLQCAYRDHAALSSYMISDADVIYRPVKRPSVYMMRQIYQHCNIRLKINAPGENAELRTNCAPFSPHTVEIGEGIASIGAGTFAGCTQLEEVTIPASVTSIAEDAFKGCVSLKTITVSPENPVYAVIDGALAEKESGRIVFQLK